MTNQEILRKAIEKAEERGFTLDKGLWDDGLFYAAHTNSQAYFQLIFSHEFAKAFWADSDTYDLFDRDGVKESLEGWQGRLAHMAMEPEPLKYLEKFL